MTNLTQTLPNGFEHGMIKSVANSVPFDDFKHFSEKDRESMRKQKKESEKIIKARYINIKGGKERLEIPGWAQYAGQPITSWVFLHDCIYDVYKGLVEEVNGRPPLAQRSEVLDANGVATTKDGPGIREHQFVPVSF